MITREKKPRDRRWQIGENFYDTLPDAKCAAVKDLFKGYVEINEEAIVEKEKELLDIFTTTNTSLSKARKLHGGKKRQPKREGRMKGQAPIDPVNRVCGDEAYLSSEAGVAPSTASILDETPSETIKP